MSQDLLAPFRTQPTPAVKDGLADTRPLPGIDRGEKHRSVADGELATPWTLQDFFKSLNTVMRLPTRARRVEKEEARAASLSLSMPGISPGLSRALLVGGGLVVVVLTIVQPLISWATSSGHASLTAVAGVYQAGKGKHEGRRFEVTDSAVVFHTGASPTDYTWHKVQEVKVKEAADSTLYTVKYEEGKRTADLTFWYYRRPAPAIRLKNQPTVVWALTKLAPVAGPPPSTMPKM